MTDDDHRGYVGPADQYDVIGAAQFALLYALGLRAHHRLLDLGCGSLRAGRLLIPYLEAGHYVGVEPQRWLVDAALDRELGHDIVALKRPVFDTTNDWQLGHLGRFDVVLAQGMATNTGPALLGRLLCAVAQTLGEEGLAAVTAIHPGSGDTDAVLVSIDDTEAPAWRYPGCYAYVEDQFAAVVDAAGLTGRPIAWQHPRHTWWLLARSPRALPDDAFLETLVGATLDR